MATVNEYKTTTNLLNLLQEEVGDENPTATSQNRYVSLLNRAYLQVYAGGGELNYDEKNRKIRNPVIFPWAKAQYPQIVDGVAVDAGGTVTVTSGSATVTVDSGTFQTGYFVKFKDEPTVYRVTGASTLDGNVVEDSGSYTYEQFKLLYDVTITGELLIPADKIYIYESNGKNYSIPLVDRHEIDERYPLVSVGQGIPKMAGIMHFDKSSTTSTLQIRLSHYPKDKFRMELPYVKYPTALDTTSSNPVMPYQWRPILVHLAAYWHLQSDDDTRAMYHKAQARTMFEAMIGETDYIHGMGGDPDFGSISPWGGNVDDHAGSDLLGNGLINFSLRR